MDYDTVREFSGTWGLVFLVVLFISTIGYALWPGNAKRFDRAAQAPLDSDDDSTSVGDEK